MGQGVSRPSYDAGSHRPPRPSLDHLRDECRELSTPRRPRPQAWFRATADARDNQGKRLIDAQRQSKSGAEKKSLRTSGLKAIMTSLPAAASNPDCRRRSHPDCRATEPYKTKVARVLGALNADGLAKKEGDRWKATKAGRNKAANIIRSTTREEVPF